jgi:ribosomal protein S18 acetylase RimI-like enzyme
MNVDIRPFRPSQAEAVVAAIRSVYADDYPIAGVYDPQFWISQNQGPELYTFVAEGPAQEVLGVVSFYQVAPFGELYEFGRLAVRPEHRQSGLGLKLLSGALEHFSKESGAAGVLAELGCHWKVGQNMLHQLNFQEVALAVNMGPAETFAPERRSNQRFSAVLSYFDLRDRSQKVHLPPRWKELLFFCYGDLCLRRKQVDDGPALEGCCRLQSQYLVRAAVARLDFLQLGADFVPQLSQAQEDYQRQGAQVVQLHLNLEDPFSPAAAEAAFQLGYRCCGLLPRWFDGDGLLLQRNTQPPDLSHDQLSSQRAQELSRRVEFLWK